MASSSHTFNWECGACFAPNKGGKYCTMCAAARIKCQAVAVAPASNIAAASACAPGPSRHPSGIILDVVGTAGTDHGHSWKKHACCSNILENDVLVKLWCEQILVPDAIAKRGKMKEETAITVNWVSIQIDRCHVGFLPHAFVVQGSIWDGVLWQVVEVFQKDDPFKLSRAKWHQKKGFAPITVISTSDLPFGISAFPMKKDKGVDGVGKKDG